MILFLDIDGVLHPATSTGASGPRLFANLRILEDVLRRAPHVEVVISSSWREAHPLQELREFFAPDLRARIVDVTPVRPAMTRVPREARGFVRHGECMAWLRRSRPAGARWLAIDDQPLLWAPGCPNLLLIDGSTGLTREVAEELLQRLRPGDA